MKKLAALILFMFVFITVWAQRNKTDSLRIALRKAVKDTSRYETLHKLGLLYAVTYPDSALELEQEALLLAKKNNWERNQARSLNTMGNAYTGMGDCASGMHYYLKALKIYEYINDTISVVMVNANLGNLYSIQDNKKKSLIYSIQAQKTLQEYCRNHQLPNSKRELKSDILLFIGNAYLNMAKADSAKYYYKAAEQSSVNIKDYVNRGGVKDGLGEVEALIGDRKAALQYYRQALAIGSGAGISRTYLEIATLYYKNKLRDSAKYYAQKSLSVATMGKFREEVWDAAKLLYNYYDDEHNLPLAFNYFKIATAAKDSLFSQDKVKRLLTLDFNERQRQQELEAAQAEAQSRLRIYLLSGGIGLLLLLALIFWRNSRQRQKANKILTQQKEDLEVAMTRLKQTQNQLIQSEKMASLGELTAGIAHEIQNPLNFVNNFSEVNAELIDEMQLEITAGNYEEVKSIAEDIKLNEQKINMHGKRADAIVKGMLQHSKSGSGAKEPTNINALADEYLRLSYHGLRAKDKTFNAGMNTNLDPGLPKINIVQQDMGRVFINLFNNAFYAVNEKKKISGGDYKPEVSVETSVENGHVVIKVKDNGIGIPDAIKDKIMQPFFTTKPTGEGTGLGLSLTYDIIVKGHGGTLVVDSTEGLGTEFTIGLPIT